MKDYFITVGISEEMLSWGMLSAVLIVVSGYPYMRAIYKRTFQRPVVSSWCLWLVISVILLVANYQAGARWNTTLLPVIMGVINPAIIVVLSLKYGEYTWSRLDSSCIVACVVAIVVWQTTESPLLGILGGLIADAIAAVPQIIKSWKEPKDEPVFPWIMFTIASAINILAVEDWVLKFWIYPVYMTAGSIIITIPLVLYRLKLYSLKKAKA